MEQEQPNLEPKQLYNPLLSDFSVTHLDDQNEPHVYTLPAQEISTYPAYLANFIQKHLATEILNVRGIDGGNVDATLKLINEEIEVKDE